MTNDEAKIFLEAIQEAQYDGTKWEQDFILSIEAWVEDGKKVTDKQSSTLQAIYRKAVS